MAESERPQLLTTLQVAAYTKMSASFFEKRRTKGQSPIYIKIGARVFYRKEEIDDWLKENTVGGPQNGS